MCPLFLSEPCTIRTEKEHAMNFVADSAGTVTAFKQMSEQVTKRRGKT